ncbi:hypothetical protein [Streptomyces sp. NPDC006140]|uniref:hypothetical protein n=1 Tax=Streptomyces sp. NPDC006140 TaxID=3154579 RepID=UPI0033CCA773
MPNDARVTRRHSLRTAAGAAAIAVPLLTTAGSTAPAAAGEYAGALNVMTYNLRFARERSAELISETIARFDSSLLVVVTGDFNAAAHDNPVYDAMLGAGRQAHRLDPHHPRGDHVLGGDQPVVDGRPAPERPLAGASLAGPGSASPSRLIVVSVTHGRAGTWADTSRPLAAWTGPRVGESSGDKPAMSSSRPA